jgi:hypothetical protein
LNAIDIALLLWGGQALLGDFQRQLGKGKLILQSIKNFIVVLQYVKRNASKVYENLMWFL